ncbi:MAG: hypothetical protein M3Z83_08310 [Actinomycetota bacterium]|nr:hypothetical protein [Actinomycetota bacterium]
MSDQPGENLTEEPQAERGPEGSRDTGSDEPGGGPADRPAGDAEHDSDSSVKPEGAQHDDSPNLQSGD